MNAKERRKARREDLPPTVMSPVQVEECGPVQRVAYLTKACPVCRLTELRRVAGTDRWICYRCDDGRATNQAE